MTSEDSVLSGSNPQNVFQTPSAKDPQKLHDDVEAASEPHFCPIGMQPYDLVVSDSLTLKMIQAPTAFNGVGVDETGTVLWGAAVCLARWLRPKHVKGKRVLELGCGAAAPAIVSHRYGASHVVATDMEENTLQQAEYHAQQNESPIEVRKLDWDSRQGALDEGFQAEVILASDVIYSVAQAPLLAETIDAFLTNDGTAYIAARDSRTGVEDFRNLMGVEGKFVEVETIPCGFDEMPQVFEGVISKTRWTGKHSIHVFERNYKQSQA
mmetsp:Transcript_41479/g.61388  ORF Transcript_41479/g.61388 Transcript_41479/m.61388 type:complete len:267 (-) Transcript_41479:2897-3697(-)